MRLPLEGTPLMTRGRRMHERAPVVLAVSYRSTGGFLVSYSLNISRGGLFLESDSPLPVGTSLTLRMQIPGGSTEAHEIQGHVAWIREEESEEGRPGMGLAFDGVDESMGQLIDDLVASFEGLHIVLVGGKSSKSRSHLAGRLRSLLRGKVTEVGGKISAVDQLTEGVDLVVADLDRAGTEGLAFLKWVSEKLENPVSVVAMASTPEMQENAKNAGADEIVSSHGSPREFRLAVLRAISRPLVTKE